MATAHEPLGMYLHLARASGQRQRPLVRDKMLVLAGAVAAERGLAQVAACCRERVLSHNAGHLIGQYPTFNEALDDERFQAFLKKLRRDFPLEKAEHILNSLGIQLAGERETYYTDHEYAASLLGMSTEELDRRFGSSQTLATQERMRLEPPEATTAPKLKSAIICGPCKNVPAPQLTIWSVVILIVCTALAVWLLRCTPAD